MVGLVLKKLWILLKYDLIHSHLRDSQGPLLSIPFSLSPWPFSHVTKNKNKINRNPQVKWKFL